VSRLFRISDAANLAIHAMMLLASADAAEPISVAVMSERLGVSRAHLAKVFQRLAKAGLVSSTRGPQGGFVLTRPADSIMLAEIYEDIEGPIQAVECLLGHPVCKERCCVLGGLLTNVHSEVHKYFTTTRLSDVCDALRRE
jgi:Rrf2 family protein